ncbi:MAG: amidohydrolase [Bacillota bacterium]
MLAIRGATIWTGTGETIIEEGTLLVEGGRIAGVGRRLAVPAGAGMVEARGLFLVPGFIDCHCHVGIVPEELDWEYSDVNETTDPVTGHVRAIDGIDFDDPGFRDALEGGVTALLIHPGSANVIGGTDVAVKAAGPDLTRRVLRDPAGMKMAWSRGGKFGRFQGKNMPYPTTRMGVAAILRQMFAEARQLMEGGEEAVPAAKDPARRMTLEVLARVLRREIPARVHSMQPVDFHGLFRLQDEFGFHFTIDHGDEAHVVADLLARRGIPVVYGPILGDRRVPTYPRSDPQAPRLLAEAGVLVALQTDHPVVSIRDLRLQAGIAVRYGLPPEEGMKMITVNAARIMGVEDRLGTLEPGKDADFSLFAGHPLEPQSRVQCVFIDGEPVYGSLP